MPAISVRVIRLQDANIFVVIMIIYLTLYLFRILMCHKEPVRSHPNIANRRDVPSDVPFLVRFPGELRRIFDDFADPLTPTKPNEVQKFQRVRQGIRTNNQEGVKLGFAGCTDAFPRLFCAGSGLGQFPLELFPQSILVREGGDQLGMPIIWRRKIGIYLLALGGRWVALCWRRHRARGTVLLLGTSICFRPDLKSAALLLEKYGKKCERGYVGLSTNST